MIQFQVQHLSPLRKLIQGGFTIFCLWMGYRFYLFFLWAFGKSEVYVPRPPSVEGFLPISALMGLKRFVLTGHYDVIHPAGLTILIAAIVIAFLLRKGFCGWICPVGFVSNLAELAGEKIKSLFRTPIWLDYPLLSLKYILLGFFCYLILWKMGIKSLEGFIQTPYNMAADAKMLLFFLDPTKLALGILAFLVLISFFQKNFWCRFLCPYGALLGILAIASPFQVKRDKTTCIDCQKCDKICPSAIHISSKNIVRTPECIGCLECLAVCPQKDCLTLTAPRQKKVTPLLLPLAVTGGFFLFWLGALATGHWHTQVPEIMLKKLYTVITTLTHPSF